MNNTVYHKADVTIDPRFPTPNANNIAEVFGTSAGQMDQTRGVEIINRKQGQYSVGITGTGATQIKSGSQARNAHISPDFYVR